ncbi:MAG: hypothetical protein V4487_04015 [Chlamydiota bacterium]
MRTLHPCPTFPANLDPPAARSLSLQFLLKELIGSFELLHDLQNSVDQQPFSKNIESLSNDLERFIFFSLKNPSSQKRGLLDRLCFYCEILLQAGGVKDHKILALLEEMRNPILEMKSLTAAWKRGQKIALDQIQAQFLNLYARLHLKLCLFFSELKPFIYEARCDENVLMVLIEGKDEFNEHLGERSIEKFLSHLFPQGPFQIRTLVYEGYARRGFVSVFEEAEKLIDAIEWEAPCPRTLQTH